MPRTVKTSKEKLRELLNTQEVKKLDRILRKIDIKPVFKPLTPPKEELPRLKTHTLLDDILGGGGIESGKMIMVEGEYGTGKTEIAFTLAVEADGLVVFIDTEGTFSRRRISEIAEARGKNVEEVNDKILLFQPSGKDGWIEQLAIPRQLPHILEKNLNGANLKLIIEDSFLELLDSSPDMMTSRQHLGERARLIRMHARELKDLARDHMCVVFLTDQVMDNPDRSNPYTPVEKLVVGRGGHSLFHKPDFILHLRKGPRNIRIARLIDSNETPLGERVFQINERGIDDVEDKERALETSKKYDAKMMSGQSRRSSSKKGEEVVEEETSEETET